jgi:hypothetical protein
MESAFSLSAGLCFPHFSLVVSVAEDLETRKALIRVQRERMEQLLAQLKEYVDKHDYRRTSEEFAEEKNSWMRAIDAISGMKDVF